MMMHTHPIRAAVFDIDGTLAMMDKEKGTYEALPGAVAALDACKAMGRPAVAYTNGTFFPPAHYYPLLADAGLVLDAGHILTPAAVAAHELKSRGFGRVMVMGAEGTRVPISDAGIEVVLPQEDAAGVEAIMLGWCREFTNKDVEAICSLIWDKNVPVFAASVAPFFASSKGRMLGISGAVAAMIEYTTGARATVFGKPSTNGLAMITDLTGVAPQEMVVVGDDPGLEIRMAREAGALAVGVTTGLNDTAAFNAVAESHRAQVVLPGLEGFADQEWFR
ncbi:haloacid dehalogenase [Zhengella mangrovi]|uniref:Haloacid dehalogenase n=1 Tax=Zhengella mangrovi TaxID=1982044 RepID=A0A2G1QR40_9HYPH|nr:HAD family hydrolase [Zhengella mangrovi]PHP67930.1 haloacid dehalogenase [Zhengella mangrovi]